MTSVKHLLAVVAAVLGVASPAAAASPPAAQPPKVTGAEAAPPPAWIELPAARSRWLAYSSFCWRTSCVDFLPPQMRPDVPHVRVGLGKRVRFHLAFEPTRLTLELGGTAGRSWRLAPDRASSWRVAARGLFVLHARGASGSASYLVRLL